MSSFFSFNYNSLNKMFSQFGASPISLFGANTTMKPLATSQAIATSGAAGGRCYDFDTYGMDYFLKGALAGGLCCSITHGGLVPVDVVKTRIQLDPAKYNQGMVGGFKQIIAEEGAGALASGFGPTAVGYFIQGWFKFGGVEFFITLGGVHSPSLVGARVSRDLNRFSGSLLSPRGLRPL